MYHIIKTSSIYFFITLKIVETLATLEEAEARLLSYWPIHGRGSGSLDTKGSGTPHYRVLSQEELEKELHTAHAYLEEGVPA